MYRAKKETDTEQEYVRQYQHGYLYTGYVDKVESQESGLKSESKLVLHMTVVVDIGAGMIRSGFGGYDYQTAVPSIV